MSGPALATPVHRPQHGRVIRRRDFSGALAYGLLLAGLCPATLADAKGAPRIGRLSEGGPSDLIDVFRAAMRNLGHPEVVIEDRPARGQIDELPGLAAELVGLGVDVIWTAGSVATQAAKDATRRIPIVMVSADAVGAGLVKSLARPGGNLTGLTLIATDIVGKRLELVTQLDPEIRHMIALAHGPGAAGVPVVAEWLRQGQTAARKLRLGFRFVELPTTEPSLWDGELASLAATPGTALSVIESPFFLQHAVLLAELASRHRLPTVFAFKQHVDAGGLISYGVNQKAIVERVAHYVSRILDGANPGTLPVEQPTKYELAINLKAAKALGLKIPRSLLLQASEVIE